MGRQQSNQEGQQQQQNESSQFRSQPPYNPYQTHPDPGAGSSTDPYLRASGSLSGSQPARPRRQGSLGAGHESDFSHSVDTSLPQSQQQHPFSSHFEGIPNFPPNSFPNPELYPSAHEQRPNQSNPYQRASYDAQAHQARLHAQAQGYPGGGSGAGQDWNLAFPGNAASLRRVSMPAGGYTYGRPQSDGGMDEEMRGGGLDPRLSPRTSIPSGIFPSYSSSFRADQPRGNEGAGSTPVSPVNRPPQVGLSSAYNPWNMTLSVPNSRATNSWDMPYPNAESSTSHSRAPNLPSSSEESPVNHRSQPLSAANANVDDLSDTGGSRPSTGGRAVNVKKELGQEKVGRKAAVAKKRVLSAGQLPGPTAKAAEPLLEINYGEDEDGDGEAEAEEPMDHRKRKRNRTIRSCVPCHNHKRKRPCSRCTALGLTGSCVYEIDETRDQHDPTVAEEDRLRRRVAELEQVVRELRQRQPPRNTGASRSRVGTPAIAISDGDADDGDKAGQDSKKRRVIVDRYARLKIDEAAMAQVAAVAAAVANGGEIGGGMVGVGGQMLGSLGQGFVGPTGNDGQGGAERRRASAAEGDGTGRIVGKEYMGEPYKTSLLPGEEIVYDKSGRKTFLGAPAGKSMLRRLRELMSSQTPSTLGDIAPNPDDDLLTVPEELAFTGWFPDMRKTFPFTTIWSHENFSGEIIGLLPNKQQAEVLFESWRDEICAFFVAWHTPTLESEYRRFFAMSTQEKMNVPLSSLSLYLMICALGCVVRASKSEIFGHPDRAVALEATRRGVMPDRDPKDLTASRLQSELYLSAAYQALRLCSFMSNPTIYTIQAQILINVYLLNSERAADAWSQTGTLVRQCIAMGLHKDPLSLDSRISMRDAEVRRRVWWSVAGLDALFCVSFGRPSSITFYTTNLPQDRPDDNLSDAPGSAQITLPPANVLRNETTDMSYHAAYYQLTIPSLELLDRIFRIDWNYSRSAIYGWFSRNPEVEDAKDRDEQSGHTYEDAIRLAQDIFQWYSLIPRGMRYEPEEDTVESLMESRTPLRINQSLALCVKTFMIVMILHRPYLRADPEAYPESSEICFRSAKLILSAYSVGSRTKASIFWSWWTMSFRAFHAGAVCAFLAIRQPNTELATKCLASLRGAIAIFEDRISSWNVAHPVQADLCHGLVKLQKLAVAATRQHHKSPKPASGSVHSGSSTHLSPLTAYRPGSGDGWSKPTDGSSTPLSQIKGFPVLSGPPVPSPDNGYASGGSAGRSEATRQATGPAVHANTQVDPYGLLGDGFNGPEQLAYPQMWANMFGIKVDGGELSEPDNPFGGSNTVGGVAGGTDMLGLM